MYTVIGGIEFRAFSNLTTKWLKESEFHGWIWVIRIDLDLDGTDSCFPLNPTTTHEAYGRKIARGLVAQNTFLAKDLDVVDATLTHSELCDLDMRFEVVHRDVNDNIFDEAIMAADAELEDLI